MRRRTAAVTVFDALDAAPSLYFTAWAVGFGAVRVGNAGYAIGSVQVADLAVFFAALFILRAAFGALGKCSVASLIHRTVFVARTLDAAARGARRFHCAALGVGDAFYAGRCLLRGARSRRHGRRFLGRLLFEEVQFMGGAACRQLHE